MTNENLTIVTVQDLMKSGEEGAAIFVPRIFRDKHPEWKPGESRIELYETPDGNIFVKLQRPKEECRVAN